MTTTSKVLIPAKQAEASQFTQYVATLVTAYIDKFTITNNTTQVVQISVNLVPLGGSADSTNLILSARSIAPKETYAATELAGQILDNGTYISTLATAANALTIRASGREIS